MKQLLCLIGLLINVSFTIPCHSQATAQARRILDKTASTITRKGGARAQFSLSSPKIGTTKGTIVIKGRKFHATTPQAMVWFDGKTQWSYMKKTDEVTISTPTQAQQMSMNPYTFINMYKNGYALSMETKGNFYTVHLVASDKKRSVQEMYVNINKSTYIPSKITMRQGNTWSTISISNFQAKEQPNSIFVFRAKDFPTAELIDLR